MKQRITITYETDDGQIRQDTPLANLTLTNTGTWKPHFSQFITNNTTGYKNLNLTQALADSTRVVAAALHETM